MSSLPATKSARWVGDTAIRGKGAIKLVTDAGATIAWVRRPFVGDKRWPFGAGRGGGSARDRDGAVQACERWARGCGYTIEGVPAS